MCNDGRCNNGGHRNYVRQISRGKKKKLNQNSQKITYSPSPTTPITYKKRENNRLRFGLLCLQTPLLLFSQILILLLCLLFLRFYYCCYFLLICTFFFSHLSFFFIFYQLPTMSNPICRLDCIDASRQQQVGGVGGVVGN